MLQWSLIVFRSIDWLIDYVVGLFSIYFKFRYVDSNLSPPTQTIQSTKMENAAGSLFVQNVKLLYDEMSFAACDRFNATLIEYIGAGVHQMEELFNDYTSFVNKTSRYALVSFFTFGIRLTCSINFRMEDLKAPETLVTESQTEHILSREADLIQTNPVMAGDSCSTDDQVAAALHLHPPSETGNGFISSWKSLKHCSFRSIDWLIDWFDCLNILFCFYLLSPFIHWLIDVLFP